MGHGPDAWEKGKLIYKPGDRYMGVDYQMYRMGDTIGRIVGDRRRRQAGNSGRSKARCRCSPACWRPRAACCSPAISAAASLALDAKTGKELWKFQTGSGINASPITYELDGEQYVAILSGLGGDPSFYYSAPKGGMLWVFAIDGKAHEGVGYNQEVIEKALPFYKP